MTSVVLLIDSAKVDGFREALTTKGNQPATVEGYSKDVLNFVDYLHEANIHSHDVSLKTLDEFKQWLFNKRAKGSSVRRAVIAIRMFFRYLEDSKQLHANPFELSAVPPHEFYRSREITEHKLAVMMARCQVDNGSLKAARDRAILHLLAREGLKSSELIALEWHHFFAQMDRGSRLSIPIGRPRTIGLEQNTSLSLQDFRRALQSDPRTESSYKTSKPMFVSFKGADAGRVQFGISRHGLKFAIYELGEAADLPHLNAEQLRHLAMKHKLDLGYTPDMLMNHLGLRRIGNIGKHISPELTISPITEETHYSRCK